MKMASLFLTLATFLKFNRSSIGKNEWTKLNNELNLKLGPLHHHISTSNHPEDLQVLGNKVTIVIRDFLVEHHELFQDNNSKKHSEKFIGKHKFYYYSIYLLRYTIRVIQPDMPKVEILPPADFQVKISAKGKSNALTRNYEFLPIFLNLPLALLGC